MTTSSHVLDNGQQASGAASLDDILVIAGDDQRARLVRLGAGAAFDVVWEGYAASGDVHALGQSPDIARRSADATPTFPGESRVQFAGVVADQVHRLVDERPSLRLIVIAPPSFASALRASLGSLWPSLPGEVIRRDETRLDDARLGAFVRAMLAAQPEWVSTTG
jgi:hypothetical protein